MKLTNCSSLTLWENSLREPSHETSLANAGIPDQHDFEQKLVIFHFASCNDK